MALQARKIAQEQAIKQTNLDIQCLRNYENACKNGTVSSADFTRIMGKASTQAQEYSKNIKEGTGSAQIYADKQKTLQQSIQNTGAASRVAAVGVKALSIAGNMLAGMAIAFAISKVIEGIEYLATASERAIEKTKELQQEISQISSDYQSERQTLEGLREEYDALTSKIGENGAEASLSADEYERYRDITSEILGITPKLITGWDEEGRAISNKNGLLQQSIDLLDEEYQKSLRNSTTKSKNEEIAAGIIEQKKDFDNSGDTKTVSGTRYDLVWKDLGNYINEAVANKKINYTYESTGIVGTDDADAAYAINEFVYGDSLYKATEMNTAYGWLGSLQERITSSQENFEKFANSLSNEDNPIYQWFTDEQIDELIRGADEYFQELARIEGEEQQYFQQYKDQLNLNAQAVGDAYSGLDEQTKAGITQMIDSFDYNDMTKEKFSDMATDLKDFVGKLSTDDTLRSYFNNLFKPMGEDESIEDYETRVKTGIDEITSYCENNYPAIKLSFGDVESDVDKLKTKYNTAVNKFTNDSTQTLDDVTAQYQEVIDNEYQKIQDWGLGNYAQQIKDGTIQSVFGNVDMDKRTIITWSDELKQTYKDALDSWDYDPEVGSIDTVFGGSNRFGEDLNGIGWEVAFTPILPDGTFLSQDAVYDYINTILAEAYADDGKITEDELTKIDAQGRQIGNTFIHGIFAGIDDSQNYDNNGNWAETVGRLLHFSGDFGAVEIAKREKEKAIKEFSDSNVDLEKFFADNSINTTEEIDYWNKVTEGANSAKEAVEMYNKAKGENPDEITVSFSKAFNSLDFSEQKDELLELAKAGELTPETLKSVEGYNTLLSQTGLEIKEAVKEIYKLVDATSRLSDMSSDLSSLGTAYKEFKEDGFASINAIESLREKFGELKDFDGNNLFEDFANIIGSDSTTVEEKQAAFNELATSYLLQEKALGKLTEANKDYYITQLKSMGIANAESIVTKQLKAEKQALLLKEEALALTSEGINNSSTEKIKALLKEVGATQLCREALFKLHVQEEIFNTSELDPRGKIEALIELATAYGVTSKNIENARKSIEGDKASGGHSGLHFTEADVKRIQEDLDANLLTDSEYVFSAKVDFNIDDKSNGTSKSDTYFDWIETKLDNLNDQLDETKDKAEDTFNGWKVRADAFKDAENQLKSLITTEEQAKARYLEEAKKSGLSQPYINLVQQGAIDIDKLSNDDPLKEQIESYQEWYEKAKQCDEAIAELNIDLKQLYRDSREFKWEIFDYLEDSISRITGEADYLVELLSNEDLFDDKGHLTKYADATIGLHFSSYDAYMQKAKDYEEEIKDLERQLATGGQEVLDKYDERVDAHQEAINAAKNERDAILDLVENSYQKQLDYLNKIIDKKKESLNAEKDLYEYQRDIQNKTKNISSLQKQYDALKNSDSEEDIAKAQQILVKLEEAKSDLEQTEYEKMISDTESMLDTLSSEYEQWINEKLENSDELLTSIRDSLAPDGEIVNTLKEIAGKNNTFVSDELTSSISDGANSSINSYLDEIIKLLGGDDSFFGNAGSKVKGYASGIKRSGKELAWLNENGAEIIRTKDGALLKPLDNSMVFNNESSKRLWEFSQNPSAFLEKMGMNNIIQPIFNVPKLPNIERVSNQTPVNNITHMEVVLPNVTNYDDFMNRMQNDKRFDNIVTASMNSKMTGSNSLSKFRF